MEGFVLRIGTKFLLSFALFGAILGVSTRTSAAESVKISYSAISWLMTPVWMAEELGLFKKNGLDAQLIYIPSSPTSVQDYSAAAWKSSHLEAAGWLSPRRGECPLLQ